MMLKNCPICHGEIYLPEGLEDGQHVLCPYCNEKFTYVNSTRHDSNDDSDNSIKICCPTCKEVLDVPSGLSEGQHILCTACNTKFVVENSHTRILTEQPSQFGGKDHDLAIVDSHNPKIQNHLWKQDDRHIWRGMAWRRWSARLIDSMLWRICFLALFYMAVKFGLRFENTESVDRFCFISLYFGYFIFDAVLFLILGTTLGKSVMNLSICDAQQKKIKPIRYFVRNMKILLEGYWIVLPIFGFWAQHRRVSSGEKASYDQGTDYDVISTKETSGKFDWKGVVVFVVLVVLYNCMEQYLSK